MHDNPLTSSASTSSSALQQQLRSVRVTGAVDAAATSPVLPHHRLIA